jgi:hypothetical protein
MITEHLIICNLYYYQSFYAIKYLVEKNIKTAGTKWCGNPNSSSMDRIIWVTLDCVYPVFFTGTGITARLLQLQYYNIAAVRAGRDPETVKMNLEPHRKNENHRAVINYSAVCSFFRDLCQNRTRLRSLEISVT